jgi:hypothetical protein
MGENTKFSNNRLEALCLVINFRGLISSTAFVHDNTDISSLALFVEEADSDMFLAASSYGSRPGLELPMTIMDFVYRRLSAGTRQSGVAVGYGCSQERILNFADIQMPE